jgi:ABC-type uncharacterized transport system permease subunit
MPAAPLLSTYTAVVLFLSSFAVLVYNISGMYVTEQVGAAARTVLENARTLLVWLVSKMQLLVQIKSASAAVLGLLNISSCISCHLCPARSLVLSKKHSTARTR